MFFPSPLCNLCAPIIMSMYVIQVRASNVVELIYKQGQAGVTKATVSIKFDNTDAQNRPVGYEDKEKIIVTRQVQP
jgi:chromosome segregation ATPase